MLKKRLIPKLLICHDDHKNELVVTTRNYDGRSIVGDPVSQARIYQHQMVDELIFLNIDNTRELSIDEFAALAIRISEDIFMPVTFGGGVKTKDDVRLLLKSGADKVSINSMALENPELITELSEIYGAQCVVVSIDYRVDENGDAWVYTASGKIKTDWNPVEWAKEVERRGAGEILITSIDNDGTRGGLCLEVTREVADAVTIPVIGSGGCGLASHFIDGFIKGGVDAVCAGTYFAFKDENPMQCRSQVYNAGVPIRRLT